MTFSSLTKIDKWFLRNIAQIVEEAKLLAAMHGARVRPIGSQAASLTRPASILLAVQESAGLAARWPGQPRRLTSDSRLRSQQPIVQRRGHLPHWAQKRCNLLRDVSVGGFNSGRRSWRSGKRNVLQWLKRSSATVGLEDCARLHAQVSKKNVSDGSIRDTAHVYCAGSSAAAIVAECTQSFRRPRDMCSMHTW